MMSENVAPYSTGIFETIVGVHFGKPLFLLVILDGNNQSFSLGPYPPAPHIDAPTLGSTVNKSGVKLLDVVRPSGGGNTSGFNQFLTCSFYSTPDRWIEFFTDTGGHGSPPTQPPVNGSCSIYGDGFGPIDYGSFITNTTFFLYSIPAGDGLITVDVNNIAPTFDSGFGPPAYSQTTTNGSGGIEARVYSRTRGKIAKVSDLLDYKVDGKPRPTQDDTCGLPITTSNQGSFLVNVHQDTNKADAQIDNYGKTFQPYKVTLTPDAGVGDEIPSQPPPRLG
jgi:hypothetical protein